MFNVQFVGLIVVIMVGCAAVSERATDWDPQALRGVEGRR